jgi:phosphate starvation-inducible protein PhoH
MQRHIGRLILVGMAAAAFAALPAMAGAKDPKKPASHSMTGCLAKGETADTYKLTDVTGTGPKTVELLETATGVDLAPHLGHKVTITGTTIKAAAAAKAEGTAMKQEATEHHMHVDAVKMVSATCP